MKYEPGDIVRHTSEFLRSVGWITSVPANGRVIHAGQLYGKTVLTIHWSNNHTAKVPAHTVELCPRARGLRELVNHFHG